MLTLLRKRLHKDEEDGFTLIELMVVVLIIAILIAIAIPTFLGAQNRARDRGAQSNLRNAITAAKTISVDSAGLFLTGTPPAVVTNVDMATAEPSLTFVPSGTAVATEGPINVSTAALGVDITLYNKSASGKFFCIKATSNGAVTYGSDAAAAPTACTSAKW